MKKDKENVREMFDAIASRYDFLNHFLTFGIDKRWRNIVAKLVSSFGAKRVLDVATGTGDLAIAIAKKSPESAIVAVDMAEKMLQIADQKIAKLSLAGRINTQLEDALSMSFEDNSFDALTVSFGVRNFENLDKGLKEMLRVVKPLGRIIIMEVATPSGVLYAPYMLYFRGVLPLIGKIISKDKNAYTYLPQSAIEFPSGDKFVAILENNGYRDVTCRKLMGGVAMIYCSTK